MIRNVLRAATAIVLFVICTPFGRAQTPSGATALPSYGALGESSSSANARFNVPIEGLDSLRRRWDEGWIYRNRRNSGEWMLCYYCTSPTNCVAWLASSRTTVTFPGNLLVSGCDGPNVVQFPWGYQGTGGADGGGGSGGGRSGGGSGGWGGEIGGGGGSISINGIGTKKNDLFQEGDVAGPSAITANPVLAASGFKVEDTTDLVVKLPGTDFELTRNFTGNSQSMPEGSFGWVTGGGWTMSIDTVVSHNFPHIDGVINNTTRGYALLSTSPMRDSVLFQNLDYNNYYELQGTEDSSTYRQITTKTIDDFRPMGPGTLRLRYEPYQSWSNMSANAVEQKKHMAWVVSDPGGGTSIFYGYHHNSTSYTTADGAVTIDPHWQDLRGRLWQQIDTHGNYWTYEYDRVPMDNNEHAVRLKAVHLHGRYPGDPNTKAVVHFYWDIAADATPADPTVRSTGMLKAVEVWRPNTGAVGQLSTRSWVRTDVISYLYVRDYIAWKKAQNASYDANDAFGRLGHRDTLIQVNKKTITNLPQFGQTAATPIYHPSVTLYRYTSYQDNVMLRAVFSPEVVERILDRIPPPGEGQTDWFDQEPGYAAITGSNAVDLKRQYRLETGAFLLHELSETASVPGSTGKNGDLKLKDLATKWITYWGEQSGSYPTFWVGKVCEEFLQPSEVGHLQKLKHEHSPEYYRAPYANHTIQVGDPNNSQSWYNIMIGLGSSIMKVREFTRDSDTGGDFVPRRIRQHRSEDRVLGVHTIDNTVNGVSNGIILLTATPYTVAEMVTELVPATGQPDGVIPTNPRRWLTKYSFDEFNRQRQVARPSAVDLSSVTDFGELVGTVTGGLPNAEDIALYANKGLIERQSYVDGHATAPLAYNNTLGTLPWNIASSNRIRYKSVSYGSGGTNHVGTVSRLGYFTFPATGGTVPGRPDLIRESVKYNLDPVTGTTTEASKTTYTYEPLIVSDVGGAQAAFWYTHNIVPIGVITKEVLREGIAQNGEADNTVVTSKTGIGRGGTLDWRLSPGNVFDRTVYDPWTGDPIRAVVNASSSSEWFDSSAGTIAYWQNFFSSGTPSTWGTSSTTTTLTTNQTQDIAGTALTSTNTLGKTTTYTYTMGPLEDADLGSTTSLYIPKLTVMVTPPAVDTTTTPPKLAGVITREIYNSGLNVLRSTIHDGSVTGTLVSTKIGESRTSYLGCGLVESQTVYPNLGAATTDTDYLGKAAVTTFAYDGDGQTRRVTDPMKNLTETIYDAQSRPIQTLKGVNTAHPTVNSVAVQDSVLVSEQYYDISDTAIAIEHTGIGDSYVSLSMTYTGEPEIGGSSTGVRMVRTVHDARGNAILSVPVSFASSTFTPLGPAAVQRYDNLGRVFEKATLPLATSPALSSLVTVARDTASLASVPNAYGVSRSYFNARGAIYRTESAVIPTSGSNPTVQAWLRSDTWFDERGRTVAVAGPSGLVVKTAYDDLSRPVKENKLLVNNVQSLNYSAIIGIDNGFLMEQTITAYHANKSLVSLVKTGRRFHTQVPNSNSLSTTNPVLGPNPIWTYARPAYDAVGRMVATINYGTNGPDATVFASNTTEPAEIAIPTNGDPDLSGLTSTLYTRTYFNGRGQADETAQFVTPEFGGTEQTVRFKALMDGSGRAYATIDNYNSSSAPQLAWNSTKSRWTVSSFGSTSADENRVSSKVFDLLGNTVKQVAHLRGSSSESVQVTQYDFARPSGTFSSGSAETNTDKNLSPAYGLLYQINYPATTGAEIGEPSTAQADRVVMRYNRLGEQRQITDQNTTRRIFLRDKLGRMVADTVDFAPPSVDQSIKRIITQYDTLGRTSGMYSSSSATLDPLTSGLASSGSIKNYVQYGYSYSGDLTTLEQSTGPLNRTVKYNYDSVGYGTATRHNYHRLASMGYPDDAPSTVSSDDLMVLLDYGISGGPDDLAGRVLGLKLEDRQGTSPYAAITTSDYLVKYSRLGLATTVMTDIPGANMQLDRTADRDGRRIYGSFNNTNNEYRGWDKFGRLTMNTWAGVNFGYVDHPTPAPWQEAYTYDRSSRRLQREFTPANVGYTDWTWRFAYDRLSRIVRSNRGRLNGLTFSNAGNRQDYELDELGNWKSFKRYASGTATTPDLDEARTHNATNELVSRGSEYRDYDDNGNLTRTGAQTPSNSTDTRRLTFDGWNRLVKVELRAGTSVTQTILHTYNGLNWRVSEAHLTTADATKNERRDLFYSNSWQIIEEQISTGDAVNATTGLVGSGTLAVRRERQFYGLRGTDDVIYRRVNSDGDTLWNESTDHAFYQLTNSQFSVVGHVDAGSKQLMVRMNYDAYGDVRISDRTDYNGDGFIDYFDYDDYVAAFENGEPSSDFNGDGFIDFFDYDDYVAAFSSPAPDWIKDLRIGYCGYVHDASTDWYLARARWYDQVAGRWITRDPAGYVDGLSMYLFVKGNPLSFLDPMGLMAEPKRKHDERDPTDIGYGNAIVEGISEAWNWAWGNNTQREYKEREATLNTTSRQQAHARKQGDAKMYKSITAKGKADIQLIDQVDTVKDELSEQVVSNTIGAIPAGAVASGTSKVGTRLFGTAAKEGAEVALKEAAPELLQASAGAARSAESASPELLQKVTSHVESKGGSVIVGDAEATRMLDALGANASTAGENIVLRADPTKTELIEEMLHAAQNRTGMAVRTAEQAGGGMGTGQAGNLLLEYKTADFMSRHARMLGLSSADATFMRSQADMYMSRMMNMGIRILP